MWMMDSQLAYGYRSVSDAESSENNAQNQYEIKENGDMESDYAVKEYTSSFDDPSYSVNDPTLPSADEVMEKVTLLKQKAEDAINLAKEKLTSDETKQKVSAVKQRVTDAVDTISDKFTSKGSPSQDESFVDYSKPGSRYRHTTYSSTNPDPISAQTDFEDHYHFTPIKQGPPVPLIIVGAIAGVLLVGGIIVFIATRKPADQEPPAASAPATSTEAPVQATASPAQEDKIISSGYIDAGSNAYATIYEAADTSSSTLARAYTGDTVDIYSIENNWYRVKFGSVTGYLPAEFVTFSEPVKETAPPAAEKPAEQPTQAPTQPVQKPTCSANIIVDTSGGGDGGTFYLNVSGSYAYYVYSARAYYSSGDYEDLGQFKSSDSKVRLTAGSVFSYVTANVTPYSIDDTAGDAVSCRGDMPVSQPKPQSANVTPCNMYGFINTHGYKICSFTTDYVVNNGKEAYVRESLGHDWSVKAVNYCYSYGVEWYELYDADDGDYYGWVDANYIDFGG